MSRWGHDLVGFYFAPFKGAHFSSYQTLKYYNAMVMYYF